MGYDLKNVFYLGNDQEYTDAYAASEDSVQPIDVSAYVDPISKGRAKGQGLAIYKVHCQIATPSGCPPLATETASMSVALSVKPYTTTGERLTGAITAGDLSPSSDLVFYGTSFVGTAAGEGSPNQKVAYLEPSTEVPYVVVRDTIFQIMSANALFNADISAFFRMECAMIALDTATLNQLLRTQTA